MIKTIFIVIDLTPDFNFFLPETWSQHKPTPINFNNSFTLNFSVYTWYIWYISLPGTKLLFFQFKL